MARSAFFPSAAKLYTTRRVSVKAKLRLFEALVMTRLLFGVEAWHKYPRSALQALESFMMQAVRRITRNTRVPRGGYEVLSDEELRNKNGVESIESRVRRRRLAHAAALVRTPWPELNALIYAAGKASTGQAPSWADAAGRPRPPGGKCGLERHA